TRRAQRPRRTRAIALRGLRLAARHQTRAGRGRTVAAAAFGTRRAHESARAVAVAQRRALTARHTIAWELATAGGALELLAQHLARRTRMDVAVLRLA